MAALKVRARGTQGQRQDPQLLRGERLLPSDPSLTNTEPHFVHDLDLSKIRKMSRGEMMTIGAKKV